MSLFIFLLLVGDLSLLKINIKSEKLAFALESKKKGRGIRIKENREKLSSGSVYLHFTVACETIYRYSSGTRKSGSSMGIIQLR